MKLSPSRLATFLSCGKRFEYKYIDKLPDPTGAAAVNGTAIHEALERLYELPQEERTLARSLEFLESVVDDWDPEANDGFSPQEDVCQERIWQLFDIEDPTTVNARRTEMDLELPWFDSHELKGIIDRVDVEDDGYVIVDYKSGKAPSERYMADKLMPMKFYALMGLKAFGTLPKSVRLLFLGTPQTIEVEITPGMVRGVEAKAKAAVAAIEAGEFEANPSSDACRFCSYQNICPSYKKPLAKKAKRG